MTAERLDIEAVGPDSPSGLQRASSGGWRALVYACVPGLCSMCHRGASELWRRIMLEVVIELPMLRQRWLIILFGLLMQYMHGVAVAVAHRMHRPAAQPLHDLGFHLLPELGAERFWVSEAIFGTLFIMFTLWSFTPFVLQRKRFYTVVMWSRLLMVLVVCQVLRVITFSVTQLPGPSYHCRLGELTAVRQWPEHWTGHLVLDLKRQVTKSCGDLIFSSHTIFMLTGILAYNEYGSWVLMKGIAWTAGVIVSTLIVASRKHYTVDVVVAWYTVPLVFYTLHRRWTTRRPVSDAFLGALGENDEPDPCTPEGGNSAPQLLLLHHSAHLHEGGGGGVATGVCCTCCGTAVANGLPMDQVMVDIKGLGDMAHCAGGGVAGGGKLVFSHPKGRSVSTLKLAAQDSSGGSSDEGSASLNNGGGGAHGQQGGGTAGIGGGGGVPHHHGHRASLGSAALGLLTQHLQQFVPGAGTHLNRP